MKKISTGQIIALVVACSVIGLGIFLFTFTQYTAPVEPAKSDIISYKATLTGEYLCLPHKDPDAPHTMECAFGLKTDTEEYYALDFNLMPEESSKLSVGDRISANGIVTPLELLSSDGWQQYPIEGIFSATDSLHVIK